MSAQHTHSARAVRNGFRLQTSKFGMFGCGSRLRRPVRRSDLLAALFLASILFLPRSPVKVTLVQLGSYHAMLSEANAESLESVGIIAETRARRQQGWQSENAIAHEGTATCIRVESGASVREGASRKAALSQGESSFPVAGRVGISSQAVTAERDELTPRRSEPSTRGGTAIDSLAPRTNGLPRGPKQIVTSTRTPLEPRAIHRPTCKDGALSLSHFDSRYYPRGP